MEESQESIIAEPVTTPEPQRGFTKAFVPLITSAALLFGGVSEAHSAGHSVDSSDQTSDHVLNLSQQELSEIQKT
jgi:hypothetical protein